MIKWWEYGKERSSDDYWSDHTANKIRGQAVVVALKAKN
jgi:hypothetical protein